MSILERLEQIKTIQSELLMTQEEIKREELQSQIERLTQLPLSASDKLVLARHPHRPKARVIIDALVDNFFELQGDRCYGDDAALLCGLGMINDIPVTILAQNKGVSLPEKQKAHFGMMHPEGYRKAIRLAQQAEKFNRPIITLIDTSGAYPGIGAEERGQHQAIGECLKVFSQLKTPSIGFVMGEGGSGGALALSVVDRLYMLEHAVYSILSPEGFAAILYKDEKRVDEATEKMKITAQDLLEANIIDGIIHEPLLDFQNQFEQVIKEMKHIILQDLAQLQKIKPQRLVSLRHKRIRHWGEL